MRIDLNEISVNRTRRPGPDLRRHIPVSAGKGLLSRETGLFSAGLPDRKKEHFYSEIGILLSSGIDIKTSLEIYLRQQTREKDRKLFQAITDKVIAGESLSGSLKAAGKFSPYEYYSLQIGEESGRQPEVLNEIAGFFSRKIRQKRQLTGAVTYPLVVLFTAIFSVYFMLAFIVPLFEDVFARFNSELPLITKKIILLSEFLKANLIKILLTVMGATMGLILARRNDWYRSVTSRIMLGLPRIGNIIKKLYLARFCQTMSLLMSSKTPMIKSVDLVSRMIRFYPFEKALQDIQDRILHGSSLSEAMKEHTIFDARIISLTRVAEEVNQLEHVFTLLARQYSEELEHRIAMMSNLLEPLMIIVVGVIVAIVLVSMYLPLFQLSASIL